ncbi:MAG: hypothetical protein Q8R48_07830 [Candidatus Omnitrophota bacterium]|nr:hypothetical protein [Candidatus Omnitrophota bacterium]
MDKRQHLRASRRFYALLIIGIIMVGLFVFSAPVCNAATIEVRPGQLIQDAINQAVSGDTVFVFSGIYAEDIVMESGVTLEGDHYARVILKGKVLFKDEPSTLKNITILFPESNLLSYTNSQYSEFKLENDAGITIINSSPIIQNCAIRPDLETINGLNPENPALEYYGKAIQIWNLYNNPEISPNIENSLIQDTDCGIYYFAQAFSGEILGRIKNNTFYHNKDGVILRMHKENPQMHNNIFDKSGGAAIYFTYEDGGVFGERKENINNNLFYENVRNFWCDESQSAFDLIDMQSNISANPLFISILDGIFYVDPLSPCIRQPGSDNIGAYGSDSIPPILTNILPAESRFTGSSSIDLSGDVSDNSGILSVSVISNSANSQQAVVNGAEFSAKNIGVDFGLNNIDITAKDVAGNETSESRTFYNFHAPVSPPQF